MYLVIFSVLFKLAVFFLSMRYTKYT